MKAMAAALLIALLTGCSSLREAAHGAMAERDQTAAIADVATTGAALALGATEANPLGLLTLPLKLWLISYSDDLPDGEKQSTKAFMSSTWTGAAANNLCVIAAILTGGAWAPACVAVGVVTGVTYWRSTEEERAFWLLCAEERIANPRLGCSYTKP